MKRYVVLSMLALSGCVSIDAPNLVSDTVKATRDLYKEATADKTTQRPTPSPAEVRVLAHSYLGNDSQTVAQIKQTCIDEAAQKLAQITGVASDYSVIENTIATLNNHVVANCKLAVDD